MRHSRIRNRDGLSLLEVILSLAILGLSLALVGEYVRMGTRSAEIARDLTLAQILCESKMAELATQAEPLQAVTSAPLDEFGEWVYSVEVAESPEPGLAMVRVTVQQDVQQTMRQPLSFTLTRWMIDPNNGEGTTTDSSGGSGTGATTSGTGGGSG